MRRAVKRYTMLFEFLMALGILPGCVWSVPTVSVTRWWAGEPTHETDTVLSFGASKKKRGPPPNPLHALLGAFCWNGLKSSATHQDIRTKLIETYIVKVWVSEELPTASFFDISLNRNVYIYFGYPVWTTAERLIIE